VAHDADKVGLQAAQGSAGEPLRLVQVTDSHLSESTGGALLGMDCDESLQEVLKLIASQQNRLDAVLCTGDISQDGSESSYRRFHQHVAGTDTPALWIPGNHDNPAHMAAALGADHACLQRSMQLGNWQLLMLNSHVDGKIHGRLEDSELNFLQTMAESLGDCRDRHILVCLHHNPLPVKAAWLQRHALQNSREFLELVGRYPAIKCILWGHVHQEHDSIWNGVRMLACPSTCIQFHPEKDDFAVDVLNPGYRWLELYPDGHIETAVERVTGKVFAIDFNSQGY
jgi:3',5'-cyclic-AMP phosphodiesterase